MALPTLLYIFVAFTLHVYPIMALSKCTLSHWSVKTKDWMRGGQSVLSLVMYNSSKKHLVGKMFVQKEYLRRKDYTREVEILSKLAHPNIIKPVCNFANEADGKFLIIFPYYKNGSLREIPCEFSKEKLVLLAAQLVSAVWYVHEQGFTHHDIKPANVLLNDSMNAVLTDFGLARPIGQERPGRGTLFAMAPEVIPLHGYEKVQLLPAVDWWSLGVTVWMLNEFTKIPLDKPHQRSHRNVGPFKIERIEHGHHRRSVNVTKKQYPSHFGGHLREFLEMMLVFNCEKRNFIRENKKIFSCKYFEGIRWEFENEK